LALWAAKPGDVRLRHSMGTCDGRMVKSARRRQRIRRRKRALRITIDVDLVELAIAAAMYLNS